MTFTPMVINSGLAGYRFLQQTQAAQMQSFAQSAPVAQETAYFQSKIKDVGTVDELIGDRTLLRVALGAFGLDEDIDNTAFLRDVLSSDLNDPRSEANRLSDKRYLSLARTFNFAGSTGAQLPDASAADDVRAILERIDNPDTLLNNANLLDRTLQAFGLEQYSSQPAFLRRVLTSDLSQSDALIYRLNDIRFVELAQAFQGSEGGVSANLLAQVSDSVAGRLQGIETAADLVQDRRLLGAVLAVYGLEEDAGNSFMIQQVLESDLRDPTSFANTLDNPAYAELAGAFGFQVRAASQNSVYGFAELFEDRLPGLQSADDLLGDTELRAATLDLFGLDDLGTDFLKAVLESDLTDAASPANTQEDLRYRAMADAFGFGAMLTGTDQAEAQAEMTEMLAAIAERGTPARNVEAYFTDARLMLATMNVFDLPQGTIETRYASQVFTAYGTDPTAPFLPQSDPRYGALYDALDFRPVQTGHGYPTGFGEAVTEKYLERQFEIRIGEIDPGLRVAMSFERELGEVVNRVSTNDARWFTLMGTPQVRTVFETAFRLPDAFAALDVERQLDDLKTRAVQQFGTDDLAALLEPDKVEELRQAYLLAYGTQTATAPATTSPLVNLFV